MADPARRAPAGGVRIGAMEAKNADLAQLRINRDPGPAAEASARRSRRWLAIGLPVAAILVLAAVLRVTGGALGSSVPVHLPPPALASPPRRRRSTRRGWRSRIPSSARPSTGRC